MKLALLRITRAILYTVALSPIIAAMTCFIFAAFTGFDAVGNWGIGFMFLQIPFSPIALFASDVDWEIWQIEQNLSL